MSSQDGAVTKTAAAQPAEQRELIRFIWSLQDARSHKLLHHGSSEPESRAGSQDLRARRHSRPVRRRNSREQDRPEPSRAEPSFWGWVWVLMCGTRRSTAFTQLFCKNPPPLLVPPPLCSGQLRIRCSRGTDRHGDRHPRDTAG